MWPVLFAADGYQVTYMRDGSPCGTVDAIAGRRNTEVDGGGFTSTVVSDDYICKIADLIAIGVGQPERGDTLVWADANGVEHFQEVGLPGAERQYDFVDQHQTLVRIHTREVA